MTTTEQLTTTPPGIEHPLEETARSGSTSSAPVNSSASSHERQLSQLSARHASIISEFAPGMKGRYRVVMKNVETKVVALQFQADVPGLPAELIDRVERFAPQPQLGPLYVSYCDDAEEELRDAEPPTQKGPDHIGATKPQTEVLLPKQTQPDPQVVAVRHERQLSQLPLEKVSASAWPATEQPDNGLEGPVEDDDGIEHSLEEAARRGSSSSAPVTSSAPRGTRWGSSSSAPVTSSATRGPGSLDEDLQAAEEQGQRRVVEEADVVQGSPPPTQKGPDHSGTTEPQTVVSCDADTGTTRHATSQAVISDTEIASAEKLIKVCVRFLSGETFECSLQESQTLSTLEGMVLNEKEIPECMTVKFLQGTKELDHSLPASALEVTDMNAVITEIEGAEQRRAAAEQSTALALRILNQTEAAAALAGADGARATQELVAAREALERAPHRPSLAAAVQAVSRALTACPQMTKQAVRAAERAVRDCFCWHTHVAAPRNKHAFIAAARKAFGGKLDDEELIQLELAYSKGPALFTNHEAFRSNSQWTAERRGGPRPERALS